MRRDLLPVPIRVPRARRSRTRRQQARRPRTAAAYLATEVTAGWLTWLFAGTVVLLPTWATAWAGIERRLVVLAGLPPIAPREAGRAGRPREVAFALVLAVVAVLGTVAGTILLTAGKAMLIDPFMARTAAPGGPLASLPGRGLTLLVGLIGACLVPRLVTGAASGLAHLSTALLSPRPERLSKQVDALVDRAVAAEDRLVLERKLMEQRLHDGAQLHLSAAGFRLGLLELQLADVQGAAGAAARRALGELREQIDAAADAVREVAHGLSPRILSEQGLGPALEELAAGLPVETEVNWAGRAGAGAPSPSDEASEDLYLIASEAITNAMKHSECSRIEVDVARQDDVVQLMVRDDGAGGAAPTGRGILSMAARARRLGGTFELVSPDGGPTTVTVRIPSGGPR